MKISLFASSIRLNLYEDFFGSLSSNKIDYEIVFAGKCKERLIFPHKGLRYIQTEDIKPTQCYEIARRECIGELVMWVADDCEFSPNLLDKVYEYWVAQENEKLLLSIPTKEDGVNNIGTEHRFYLGNENTPLMAPLGVISRRFLDDLGGIDRRFVCGQYENDIAMRVYENGGTVELFDDGYVTIEHSKKHDLKESFIEGLKHGRETLESFWVKDGNIVKNRLKDFEGFDNENILINSQSFKGAWK